LPLIAGSRLGPYEILAPLGAGGMGEVYRARDARLKRDVALKVLPAAFSADADRLRRFEQEAQSASALNHPNILAIHDIGTHEGAPYIVSELLEGETLRARLSGGAFSPRKAIGHALQIAQGLAAAHEKGIVHRDLKPENIFVTADGRVKILDFGLAKLTQAEAPASGQTNLPTEAPGTEPGVVLGTLGYMSPEQVRGKPADARSDLFSFGAIFYEMLSGRRAFHGETAADTMSAILTKDPPDLSETNRRIPEALERIVGHCLERSPEARFQSARDIAFDLEAIAGASLSSAPRDLPATAAWRARFRLALPWLAVPVAALAFLAGKRMASRGPAPGPPAHATFRQLTLESGVESFPSLSPDGATVAYAAERSGRSAIFVRRVGGQPIELTKDSDKDDSTPAFSPSGDSIAFRSERGGGGLFLMGATGENARRLADTGFNPAWSPDGKEIAYSTEGVDQPFNRSGTGQLWAVDVATGGKRAIVRGQDAVQPSFSPHGRRIAFWGVRGQTGLRDLWTVSAAGENRGEAVAVTNDPELDWNPVWSADGKYLYFGSDRGGSLNLWRVPIEEETGRVVGEPEAVTLPATRVGPFGLSRDGRHIAYQTIAPLDSLVRFAFDERNEKLVGEPTTLFRSSMQIQDLDASPDGQWIAFRSSGRQEDLFLIRSDGSSLRQLTDDPFKDRGPIWSPDGKTIAFYSNRSGRYDVWTIHPDGSGLAQVTKGLGKGPWYPHWSPDGSMLACPDGANSYLVHLGGNALPAEALPLPGEGVWFQATSWSPDGRTLAGFLTTFGGEVRGLALYSLASRKYERLSETGDTPIWLRDGRRLLFNDREAAVLLDTGTKKSHPLGPPGTSLRLNGFTLSRDGRSLFGVQRLEEGDLWAANLQ
jgi:Tol biopolymer transport system component